MTELKIRHWHRHLTAGTILRCIWPALLSLALAAGYLILAFFEPALALRYWVWFAIVMFVLAYLNMVKAMERYRGRRRR